MGDREVLFIKFVWSFLVLDAFMKASDHMSPNLPNFGKREIVPPPPPKINHLRYLKLIHHLYRHKAMHLCLSKSVPVLISLTMI